MGIILLLQRYSLAFSKKHGDLTIGHNIFTKDDFTTTGIMYIFPPNRHDDFTVQQFTYDDFTACIVFFSSNSNGF